MTPSHRLPPGLLNDRQIREHSQQGMISPFEEKCQDQGVISYGLSSYGYDARIGAELKIFRHMGGTRRVIDPKAFDTDVCETVTTMTGEPLYLPPHGFALAHTVETFSIPREVMVICLGKSTYARTGLIVNVTPLEPGFIGQVTLELSNTTDIPIKIYPHEGICQFLFFRASEDCEVSYDERGGKYMNQCGIVTPKVKSIEPDIITTPGRGHTPSFVHVDDAEFFRDKFSRVI